MMLGRSSEVNGTSANVAAVAGAAADDDGGVAHGAALKAFARAIHHGGPELEAARAAVTVAAGTDAMIDAAAVCANFQMSSRIADATGTPLDDAAVDPSQDVRRQLNLDAMSSKRLHV